MWSPGIHGMVGGGGDINGLSNSVLVLLAKEMQRVGLAFNQVALAEAESGIDVISPLRGQAGLLSKAGQLLVTHKPREGPSNEWEIAPSTIERWKKDPEFRADPVLNKVSDWLYHRYG